MTNSASDDKACVSKFNQVENDLQNYINAQMIILQDAALRSRPAGESAELEALRDFEKEIRSLVGECRSVANGPYCQT